MCMVAPNPCLFNKSCALLLNLWTIVLHLCLENQDLNFAMKQDFYFYVLLQNDHQPFFFLFSRFFH